MGRYVILRHDCENGRGLSPFVAGTIASTGTIRQGWSAEQKGTVPLSAGRLRTSGPGVHWDLMLEWGEALRTWALAAEPIPGVLIAAEQLPDHRLAYLDYEGPIYGNRGSVARWDAGRFEVLSATPITLVISLASDRLQVEATLARSSAASNSWEFIFYPRRA
jgi:DNA polymerase Ligase (LigD)